MDHEEDDWGKGHPELRSHMSETRKVIVNSLLQTRTLLLKTLLQVEVSSYPNTIRKDLFVKAGLSTSRILLLELISCGWIWRIEAGKVLAQSVNESLLI